MKMAEPIFKNLLKETSNPRTPDEFICWFKGIEDALEEYHQGLENEKAGRKFRNESRIRRGRNIKFYYEELWPLFRLLEHKKKEWQNIKVTPIRGNQNFDVLIESSDFSIPNYLEITLANFDKSTHQKMLILNQRGRVNALEKGLNTRKTIVDSAIKKIEARILDKSQKQRPPRTALLVFFDDYLKPFEEKESKIEMNDFKKSLMTWRNQYTHLFIVGTSGKRFWELS